MQKSANYISVDKDIQFGKPVFIATGGPVQSLFCHLKNRISLCAFIVHFPGLKGEQAEAIIQ